MSDQQPPSDPNMHYDGTRWLRWDGTQWLDAASGGPVTSAAQVAPAAYPPTPEKPKSNTGKILAWVGGGFVAFIVLIIVVAVVAGGGSNTASTTSGTPAPASSGASPATSAPAPVNNDLNKPVRDGNFEFTVTGWKNAGKSVGTGYAKETAQGTFWEATMTVKNIGNDAGLLADSDQKAFNASDQEYSADSLASIAANGGSTSTFLQDINPGNSVAGKIVWDVPTGTKVTHLELHDSPFSGGVTVNLP